MYALITIDEAIAIKETANPDGDLIRPDGRFHNSNTIATMLAFHRPGKPNSLVPYSGFIVHQYLEKINGLLTQKYIKINHNPSRLSITDKFNELLKEGK